MQSTSTLPEENYINIFDVIPGRSFVQSIALKFEKGEFETTLFFFSGLLYEQVLQYLPGNWSPIRIVSFTRDKFQILNHKDVSMQVRSITTLCLNDVELDYAILSNLKCLSRLEIRNVTSSTINIEYMVALVYVKLVDFVCQTCDTALRVRPCPRLQEVVLDRCFNVDFVFDTIKEYDRGIFSLPRQPWGELSEEELEELDRYDMFDKGIENLQKLFIKDCPHLVDIHSGFDLDPFSELKEVQVMNCPLWRGSTWNHGGNQPSGRWTSLCCIWMAF